MFQYDSVLAFDCTLEAVNDKAFLGEFPTDSDIPEALWSNHDIVSVYRVGDTAVCRDHPMMSPLPDLVIENADALTPLQIWDKTLSWWNETYGGGA